MVKGLVTLIVSKLVDRPQDISVNEISSDQATIIELRVAQEDLGKVIGKEGRTARSIRMLIGAIASKDNKRAVLEIVE